MTLLWVRAGCRRRRRRGRLQRMAGCDFAICGCGGGNVNGVSGGLGCGVLTHVVELVDYVAG